MDLESSGFLDDENQERNFYNDVNNNLDSMRIVAFKYCGCKECLQLSNHDQVFASLPRLSCAKFSGNKPNKFEFKNFLSQFYNCVNSVSSKKAKLSLLKSYLTGYAGQLISPSNFGR